MLDVRASRRSGCLDISLNHNRNSETRIIEIRIVAPPTNSYFADLRSPCMVVINANGSRIFRLGNAMETFNMQNCSCGTKHFFLLDLVKSEILCHVSFATINFSLFS